MNRKKNFSMLRWVSLALIFSAVLVLVFELVVYSRLRATFSPGARIADVPVAGLTQDQAAARITQAYSIPVEMHYGDAVIQVKPAALGFSLDLASMMAAADQARISLPFWTAFYDFLFNQLPATTNVPLKAKIDEQTLRAYLKEEIGARYDSPAEPYTPIPGSVNFEPGKPGSVLDVDRSVDLVSAALRSPSARTVKLTYVQVSSEKPSLENLKILLKQILDLSQFDGVAEIYMRDMQTQQEMQFAYQNGENLQPDIAFSAESIIKVPVMVGIYQRIGEPTSPEITDLMERMIERSQNDPPDLLMKQVIDPNLGPLGITADMQELGLKNTFLGGMFYAGAPLLKAYKTPANSRTDVDTQPDPYSQTTPSDIGTLLDDIYQCAQNGGGTFAAVFPGEISQNECKSMLTYLTRNKIGVLLEAGLPEGTQIAHKHGWATDPTDGLMHTIGDAGIIYSPGGNYILTVFLQNNNQVVFDNANRIIANISSAVYNYFNLTAQ
ncbi:MAG: serine hydrolase [Anaerolineaceae bacterium]